MSSTVYLSGMPVRLILACLASLGMAACASAPPYQGVEAGELFAIGEAAFESGNHNEAQKALDQFLISFPTHERVPDARMMLARSYYEDEEYVTAIAEYQRFIDRHPSHPSAPEAALGRCRASAALSPRIQRDQAYTAEAVEVCLNVAADYPGTPAGEEAARTAEQMRLKLAQKLYEVGDYYYRRDFFDSSIIYWEMVEEQYADTEWAPRALLGIMEAYREIGYDDLVEETRQKILESYPDSDAARGLANDDSALAPTDPGR